MKELKISWKEYRDLDPETMNQLDAYYAGESICPRVIYFRDTPETRKLLKREEKNENTN